MEDNGLFDTSLFLTVSTSPSLVLSSYVPKWLVKDGPKLKHSEFLRVFSILFDKT